MRKLFSLFLALVATTSLWAHDFEVDGIYYNYLYNKNNNNVEVTYRGNISYNSYNNEYVGKVIIPSTVTYNGTTYSVTSIGYGAFGECTSLKSVTIPNSVTSIGSYAFLDCSSLTSITIPNSVTSIGSYGAFRGCSSLKSITIPNSVTSIGEEAFRACSSLKSITIPNSVTSIEYEAFRSCSSLTSITIPNSVTSIGDYAFYYCSSLTSITIPNSVTSIGEWAFSYCTSLTSVTIGNSVTSIEDYAFNFCSSLTSVTINSDAIVNKPSSSSNITDIFGSKVTEYIIGDDVKGIGDYAFCQSSSLTSITIPNSVTSIGDRAFSYCTSLTSITIPNSVTSIGSYVFYYCYSLTSVTVGNSVTRIRDGAFYDCSKLTSVTIGNSVTSIGDGAFSYCTSLTSITIPNSVTSIGWKAFRDCSSLTSVTIPNSVTSIGHEAFSGCSSLDTLTCLAMTPPALGSSVFYGCDNPTLYVPCEALPDYQAHEQWGQFTTIECIASEEAETEEVVVESGTTTVTITWPTEDNADTYNIVIKKDGEVFCTLTFNAEGQLLNIAFAPGRDGNHPAQYAEQAGKGYRFTVTSLESGTKYGYNIDVKDAANKTIKSHSGEFTTQSTTTVDNITTNNANIQKIMRNGQLIILRDGIEYNAIGQEL